MDVIQFANSSGEFHTFRLPVASLWPDILEKVKAAGLNGISVYTHMGLINPAPGVVDFGGFRALQPLYDAAKAAGIWIVLRPGRLYHVVVHFRCSLSLRSCKELIRHIGPYLMIQTSILMRRHRPAASLIGRRARLPGVFAPTLQIGRLHGKLIFKASLM